MSWAQKLVRWMVWASIPVMGWGQNSGQNVVNVRVIPSTTISSLYNFKSSPLQNIGQTNHVSVLTITGVSGGGGTPSVLIYGNLQGSSDGTNWFNIGLGIVGDTAYGASSYKMTGFGSYPFVRVSLGLLCTVTPCSTVIFNLNYVGNSSPAFTIADQVVSQTNMRNLNVLFTPISWAALTAGYSDIGNGLLSQVVVYGVSMDFAAGATFFTLYCANFDGTVLDPNGNNLYFKNLNHASFSGRIDLTTSLRAIGSCGAGQWLGYATDASGTLNIIYRKE